MSQPEVLYRLQEVELDMLRTRNRLEEIGVALANDTVLQNAQAAVNQAGSHLNPLKARLKTLEHEIASNELKASTAEQQLYSGSIRNPKEMQEMQQEIEALKRWHSELENQILETMLAVEAAEAALQTAQSALEQTIRSQESEHAQLIQEQAELQKHLHAQSQRRAQILSEVQPENLKRYTAMKARKHNQPVAVMQGNTCSFCGVAQTIAIERAVRQGLELTLCSNCERILVSL
jgi:predicted  nucleic acid-binding Zn-ribbon protein